MTDSDERLAYQIIVSNPGTKQQNWHGILYDKNGSPLRVEPGTTVKTGIGEFVSVAQGSPGAPYGMIHADMVRWMRTVNGNVIMDGAPWSYELYVAWEGSRGEVWRGQLLHGRGIVAAPTGDAEVETPMGRYVWTARETLWTGSGCPGKRGIELVLDVLIGHPQGWFPVSWPRDKTRAPAARRA